MKQINLNFSNLLVTQDIRIKVADFGLGQYFFSFDKEYARLDGEAMLPIRWTAPEVMKTKKVTQKSDVWSFGMFCQKFDCFILGVTMYEILEQGALPYSEIPLDEI